MTYHVIAPDGNRYGPADLGILARWVMEGRVTPNTLVEDSMGRRMYAGSVEGLQFGVAVPQQVPYASYSTADKVDDGSKELLWAWGLGVSGLLVLLVIGPLAGIVMALQAKEKGQRGYLWALLFCVGSMLAGVVMMILVKRALDDLSFRT